MDERNNSSLPHYWIVSSSAFFPSAPSTRRRDSLPCRARGRRTSQQTGRGTWWWCRGLAKRDTYSILWSSPKQIKIIFLTRHSVSSYLGLPRDSPPPRTPPRCTESLTWTCWFLTGWAECPYSGCGSQRTVRWHHLFSNGEIKEKKCKAQFCQISTVILQPESFSLVHSGWEIVSENNQICSLEQKELLAHTVQQEKKMLINTKYKNNNGYSQ